MGGSESRCCTDGPPKKDIVTERKSGLESSDALMQDTRVLQEDPRSPSYDVDRTPIEVPVTPVQSKPLMRVQPLFGSNLRNRHAGEDSQTSGSDPRSPGCRTPISTKQCRKEPQSNQETFVYAALLDPDQPALLDPRSPSQGIVRTPLLQEDVFYQDHITEDKTAALICETPKKPYGSHNPGYTSDSETDPRSPTQGIDRTPVAKLEKPEHQIDDASPRNLHDPRSPTTDVSRTPLGALFSGHRELRRTVLMTNALMASPLNKKVTKVQNMSSDVDVDKVSECDETEQEESEVDVDGEIPAILCCNFDPLNNSCSSSMVASIGSEVDCISLDESMESNEGSMVDRHGDSYDADMVESLLQNINDAGVNARSNHVNTGFNEQQNVGPLSVSSLMDSIALENENQNGVVDGEVEIVESVRAEIKIDPEPENLSIVGSTHEISSGIENEDAVITEVYKADSYMVPHSNIFEKTKKNTKIQPLTDNVPKVNSDKINSIEDNVRTKQSSSKADGLAENVEIIVEIRDIPVNATKSLENEEAKTILTDGVSTVGEAEKFSSVHDLKREEYGGNSATKETPNNETFDKETYDIQTQKESIVADVNQDDLIEENQETSALQPPIADSENSIKTENKLEHTELVESPLEKEQELVTLKLEEVKLDDAPSCDDSDKVIIQKDQVIETSHADETGSRESHLETITRAETKESELKMTPGAGEGKKSARKLKPPSKVINRRRTTRSDAENVSTYGSRSLTDRNTSTMLRRSKTRSSSSDESARTTLIRKPSAQENNERAIKKISSASRRSESKLQTPTAVRSPLAVLTNSPKTDGKFCYSPAKSQNTTSSTKLPRYHGTPPVSNNSRSLSVSFSGGSSSRKSQSSERSRSGQRSFTYGKEN